MPAPRPLIRALLVGALVSAGSVAQARDLPDQTGTGGGPRSTITAPNTSSVGQVMPHPGGPDARLERRIDDRTRQERLDDRIDSGICTGCGR
ncbi:hypothetical protein [Methylobacterium platani]|uniref:Uncharacterized protein n=2 Tax=Methylobacterium platani TaxID=427683 RepID=A0A179SMY9_9HYPH|nr:hypothetical protein [Methylobacterium platani]KMO18780.1 hypothetical protein SQ03_09705 [Methylobacterium platani JCM 14648]OAS27794.1 hypothetical protein A5481_00240 [Methylobacterium platani]